MKASVLSEGFLCRRLNSVLPVILSWDLYVMASQLLFGQHGDGWAIILR